MSPLSSLGRYEQLGSDLLRAFNERDEPALQRLNLHYRRGFTFDDLRAEIWRRVYAYRQRSSSESPNRLRPGEALLLIAQDAGFGSWAQLTRAMAGGGTPVPAFEIDVPERRIAPRRQVSDEDWDAIIGVMRDQGIAALDANGLMTDSVMARVAELQHVTSLSLGGSRQLTDQGLAHLAHMPRLQHLDLSGCKVTERGLDVLARLPQLRSFALNWHRGVSDEGVAHLRECDQIERVNLMGSATGDGAIRALAGKANLRHFSSGTLVTDEGLRCLHDIPQFTRWSGPPIDELSAAQIEEAPHLLIDGPFTDRGVASMAGLDGVAHLDFFWHAKGITAAAFAHLRQLPNLVGLGADDDLGTDEAMQHVAALPRLRKLRCQGAVATDEGFEALSRSQTLEAIWGRECPNFASRGFRALVRLPALRALGISCRSVDDDALALLPQCPSLRELTPIHVTDDGFRHVGRCERLERLSCMYCRDTTDVATGHIAALPLVHYYAGLTQITDRSLEILGDMKTLEEVEFYECQHVTDAGLGSLAGLPNLRRVQFDHLPGVTYEGTRVFPARVRVRYTT